MTSNRLNRGIAQDYCENFSEIAARRLWGQRPEENRVRVQTAGLVLDDNGRYVIAGHYGDAGTAPINPHIINKKQITITGAWSAANKHFLRALKLLQKLSNEQVDRLVTHRFSLEQANEALIAAERQETLKAVIVP